MNDHTVNLSREPGDWEIHGKLEFCIHLLLNMNLDPNPDYLSCVSGSYKLSLFGSGAIYLDEDYKTLGK